METTMKSSHGLAAQRTEKKEKTVSTIWQKAESSRFAIIPILLTVLGCIGGVAAAFGAHGDPFRLSLVAFPTIISLALMLAVAPMRLIIYLSTLAIVLDLVALVI
ncbi:MAG: hypothetical protein ACJ76F_11850 [Bacteroidia bacterium]